MGAALQRGPVEAQAREPAPQPARRVRGSPECEAQARASSRSLDGEALGSAALEQGHRLQRLDGGARKDGAVDVARGMQQAPIGGGYGVRHGVLALHELAAPDQDRDRRRVGVHFSHSTMLP